MDWCGLCLGGVADEADHVVDVRRLVLAFWRRPPTTTLSIHFLVVRTIRWMKAERESTLPSRYIHVLCMFVR